MDARAAAGVAAHVDAVAVGPLPERQSVRRAAVADGSGRPEPASLEAHPLRDEIRDPAGARSCVLLGHGSHLPWRPSALCSCLVTSFVTAALLVTRAGIRGAGHGWVDAGHTPPTVGCRTGERSGWPRVCEAAACESVADRLGARAAGVGTGRAQDALRPGTPGSWRIAHLARGLPAFEAASGEQSSTLQLPPAAGRRVSLTGPPSGEQGSIRRVGPGPGWTLQVSTAGNAGKAGNCLAVSPNARPQWKGFGSFGPKCSLQCNKSATTARWSDGHSTRGSRRLTTRGRTDGTLGREPSRGRSAWLAAMSSGKRRSHGLRQW